VLVIVPVVAVVVFWLVHILPEKIAEKKKHPQTHAIQCLCLMSLVFGGLLWPLAWLWAYSKPVFYKMAYGSDVDESIGHGKKEKSKTVAGGESNANPAAEAGEVEKLRNRIAELEAKVKTEGGPV
jgi:CBS domain containing-hemolysin-like protein